MDGSSSGPQDDSTTSAPSDVDETGRQHPEEAYLANNDHDTCQQPLWCYSGGITNPTGAAFDAQDCLTSTLAPPFEITHVHYTVADAGASPVGMMLEIREPEGIRPGNVVESWSLPPNMSTVGGHVFELPQPLPWSQPSFCVGVSIPSGTSSSAVGIAVDTTDTLGGVSWIRMFGGGGCNLPSWSDAATSGYDPSGNWCIAATVRELL